MWVVAALVHWLYLQQLEALPPPYQTLGYLAGEVLASTFTRLMGLVLPFIVLFLDETLHEKRGEVLGIVAEYEERVG